jgi:hypothetical protein
MTAKNFLPKGFEPGQNHVIIGRGKQSYNHQGNLKLRKIVATRLEEYSATSTKKAKSQIISSIIDQIRTSKPEGAFLKYDKDHGYFDVGNFLSSDKISQTFRDLLRGSYRSSNAYKKNKRKSLKSQKTNTVQLSPTHSQVFDQFPFGQSFAHNMPLRRNIDLLSLMNNNGGQNLFKRPRFEARRVSMQFGMNQAIESTQLTQSKQVDTQYLQLEQSPTLFTLPLNRTLSNQPASNEGTTNALKSIAFRRTSLGTNPLHGLCHIATNESMISDHAKSTVVSSDESACDESASDSCTIDTKSKCDTGSYYDVSICEELDSDFNIDEQWRINLGELENFCKKNGFDVVPSQNNCTTHIKLAKWIEEQRNDYLNFYEGRLTLMTAVQVVELEKLGFSKYLQRV